MHQLVLASESPRRKFLLEKAGFLFQTFSVKVSENLEKNLNVNEQILAIARTKANAAWKSYKPPNSLPYLLLTADTMVVYENQALGKPVDKEDARQTLRLLSGKKHFVVTALCLVDSQKNSTFSPLQLIEDICTTEVFFKNLSETEIENYVNTSEPYDKAGSYGIQSAGSQFVDRICGDYENVVGLSTQFFTEMLKKNGLVTAKSKFDGEKK